jgi:uncharacterized protein YjdB
MDPDGVAAGALAAAGDFPNGVACTWRAPVLPAWTTAKALRRGMNSSLVTHMRKQRALALGLALGVAFGALTGCDDRGSLAGVGGTNVDGSSAPLTVLPTDIQMTVNTTTQLSTNAGSPSQLQWLSSNNNVATVSATGLVTARAVGTATITVRFAADTTNAASSNISVTQ